MDSDEWNGYATASSITQKTFTEYLNSFEEVVRIHDMKRLKKNKTTRISFLVEFKDADKLQWIDANTVKRYYPQKLIEFYETCITWESNGCAQANLSAF